LEYDYAQKYLDKKKDLELSLSSLFHQNVPTIWFTDINQVVGLWRRKIKNACSGSNPKIIVSVE
jgi:hypothetical protein